MLQSSNLRQPISVSMHYLIDGHNLIAHMPDIRLSDPDDEAQLVARLRRWQAAGRKRRITLYFDGGLPGGRDPQLSTGSLKVVFASMGSEADSLLVRRIRRVRNPPEFTVVTSDRAIITAALDRGMPVIDSHSFSASLARELDRRNEAEPSLSAKEAPELDEKELEEWMALFRKGRE